MPNYLITYLDGDSETIDADTMEPSGSQYIAYRNGCSVAYIPATNVRSITRQDTTQPTDAQAVLDRIRETANTWFLAGEPGPTRNAGKHLLAILNTQQPEQPNA